MMKIIITEFQYKSLTESLNSEDVRDIHNYGFDIIEDYDAGPYTVFLTSHRYMDMYQIGLTTTGVSCATPENQFSKVACISHKDIINARPLIAAKVSEWIDTYGKMFIASWNEKKVNQYKRMFENMGFKCSKISKFMGGIMFQVDKTERGIEDYMF